MAIDDGDELTADAPPGLAARLDALYVIAAVEALLDIDAGPEGASALLIDFDADDAAAAFASAQPVRMGAEGGPRLAGGPAIADQRLDAIAAAADRGAWAGDGDGLALGLGLWERDAAGVEDPGGRAPIWLWPAALDRLGSAWILRAAAPWPTPNPALLALLADVYGVEASGALAWTRAPSSLLRGLRQILKDAGAPATATGACALSVVDLQRAAARTRLAGDLGGGLCCGLGDALGAAALCGGAVAPGAAPARAAALETRGAIAPPPLDLDCEEAAAFADLTESDRPALVDVVARDSGARAMAAAAVATAAAGGRALIVSAAAMDRARIAATLAAAGFGESALPSARQDQTDGATRVAIAARLRQVAARPRADVVDAAAAPRTQLRALESERKRLARYGRLMTAGFGKSGLTPHAIIWGALRSAADVGPDAVPQRPEGAETLSRDAIQRLRGRIDRLEDSRPVDPNVAAVFVGFDPHKETLDVATAVDAFADIEQAASALQDCVARLRRETGAHPPATEATIAALRRAAAQAPGPPGAAAVDLYPALAAHDADDVIDRLDNAMTRVEADGARVADAFGADWLATAPALFAAAAAASQAAVDALEADAPLWRMPAAAEEYRQGVARLRAGLAAHDATAKLLLIDAPYGGRAARAFRNAVDAAALAPLDALGLRAGRLGADRAGRALNAARKAAARLLRAEDALGATFTMAEIPSAEDLSEAATILARGGVTTAFTRAYRDAKRLFQSIATPETVKADLDPRTMANRLQALSDWRFDVDAFGADGRFSAALGPAFDGIYTDFDALDRVRNWMRRTRAAFDDTPEADEAERAFAAQVFETVVAADRRTLGGLAALANRTADLDVLAAVPDPAARIARWSACADAVATAAQALADAGAVAETTFGDARDALSRIERLRGDAAAVAADPDAAALLQGRFRGANTDMAPIRTARRWALSVRAWSDLPSRLADWLLTPDAAARYAALSAIFAETERCGAALDRARATLASLGEFDWIAWCGEPDRLAAAIRRGPDDVELRVAQQRARACLALRDALPDWAAWRSARRELEAAGLGALVAAADAETPPPNGLRAAFDHGLYAALSENLLKSWPELDEYSRHDVAETARAFRRLDMDAHQDARAAAAAALHDRSARAPEVAPTAFRALADAAETAPHPWRGVAVQPALDALFPIRIADPAAVFDDPELSGFDLILLDGAPGISADLATAALAAGRRAGLFGDRRRGRVDGGAFAAAAALGAPRFCGWARDGAAAGDAALALAVDGAVLAETPAACPTGAPVEVVEIARDVDAPRRIAGLLADAADAVAVGLSPAARARLATALGPQGRTMSPWGAATQGAKTIAVWLSGDSNDDDADGWRALKSDEGGALAAQLIGAAERRLIIFLADDAAAPDVQARGVALLARAAQAAGAAATIAADDDFAKAIRGVVRMLAPDARLEGPRSDADPALRVWVGDAALAIESDAAAHRRVVTRDRERLHPQALEDRGWATHMVRSLPWRLNPDAERNRLLEAVQAATRTIPSSES